MEFTKASRKKTKLRIGLMGPSGSGKTYSALMLAQGLGKRIALIDTERGSGELYSHLCDYDVCCISAPFSPQKYLEAILTAERGGYEVIIIDSLTHAWAGEGGLLDMHDKASRSARGGNSYTAWREITPWHNKLIDAILQSSAHIIATTRTKTAYELQDKDGKKVPQKVGMAPIFREGLEYEFTLAFDISIDGHISTASKDRTSLFDGVHEVLTPAIGKRLLDWIETGDASIDVDSFPCSREQINEICELIVQTGAKEEALIKYYCVARLEDMDNATATKAIEALKKKLVKEQ